MNKNWIKYIIIAIVVILIVAITIVIYNNNNKRTAIKSLKTENELEYLNSTILYAINELNNLNNIKEIKIEKMPIEQSQNSSENASSGSQTSSKSSESSGQGTKEANGEEDGKEIEKYTLSNNSISSEKNKEIDWEKVKEKTEKIYENWTGTTIDLNMADVTNENILMFNENLDKLVEYTNKTDKENASVCLANMYALIPKYMEELELDSYKTHTASIKSLIITSYSLVNLENWEKAGQILSDAEAELNNLLNNQGEINEIKQSTYNKCYVLIKELIRSTNEKNKDTFFIKYINLIDEIDKIY